jgi:hypothetical protein
MNDFCLTFKIAPPGDEFHKDFVAVSLVDSSFPGVGFL